MRLGLKILESNSQIQKSILMALLPECIVFMKNSMNQLKATIPDIVSRSIYNRSEYQSLVGGILRLELGIPDANAKIAELISKEAEAFDVWSKLKVVELSNKPKEEPKSEVIVKKETDETFDHDFWSNLTK